MTPITEEVPYQERVYSALKDNVPGFNLSLDQFNTKLESADYQQNVHKALTDRVPGFALSQEEFSSRVSKKKDLSLASQLLGTKEPAPGPVDFSSPSPVQSLQQEKPFNEEEDKQASLAKLAKDNIESAPAQEKQVAQPFGDLGKPGAPSKEVKLSKEEEAQLRITAGIDEKPISTMEKISSFAGSLNKPFIDLVASAPKLAAIVKHGLDEIISPNVARDKPIQEYDAYKMGDWLEQKALEAGITATNPKIEKTVLGGQIPAAFGTALSLIMTGGMSGGETALGKELLAHTEKGVVGPAVKELGQHIVSRAGVAGGNLMGISEFEAAKKAGATDEEALGVYLKNVGVGATMAIPLARGFTRINEYTGGGLIQGLKKSGVQSLEMGAQGGVQHYLTGKIAQGTYDPKREPFKDILDAVGVQMFVGMVLPGIMGAYKKMTPEQVKETEKVIHQDLKDFESAQVGPTVEGTKAKETEKVFVHGELKKPSERERVLGREVPAKEATAVNEVKEEGEFSSVKPGEGEVKGKVIEVAPDELNKLDQDEEKYNRRETTLEDGTKAHVFERKPEFDKNGDLATRSNKQIKNEFEKIHNTLGRSDLEGLLDNWSEARLSEDGDKIVGFPGRDRNYSKGKEGGKIVLSKKSFLEWLTSDAPFDEKKYDQDEEWTSIINKAREAIGYKKETSSAPSKKVKETPQSPEAIVREEPNTNTDGQNEAQRRQREALLTANESTEGLLNKPSEDSNVGEEFKGGKKPKDLTPTMESLYEAAKSRIEGLPGIDKIWDLTLKAAKHAQHETPRIEDFAVAINYLQPGTQTELNRITPKFLESAINDHSIEGGFHEYAKELGLDTPAQDQYIKLHNRVKDLPASAKQYLTGSLHDQYSKETSEEDVAAAESDLKRINSTLDLVDELRKKSPPKELESLKDFADTFLIMTSEKFLSGDPLTIVKLKNEGIKLKRSEPLSKDQLIEAIKDGENDLKNGESGLKSKTKSQREQVNKWMSQVQEVVDSYKERLQKEKPNEQPTSNPEPTPGPIPDKTERNLSEPPAEEPSTGENGKEEPVNSAIDKFSNKGNSKIIINNDFKGLSKKELSSKENNVKDELHKIIKEHGSESEQFDKKHDELAQIQHLLYASTEKYYEPLGSAKKNIERISVDPIEGGEPKKLKQILLDLSKGISSKIFYTKSPSKRRSLGSYNPRNSAVAIKYKNDLDTTAHEVAHSLDDRFQLLDKLDDSATKELLDLAKSGSKPPKGHPDPLTYRKGEGIAEYIRGWLVNPKEAEARYPNVAKIINELPKEIVEKIRSFGDDIRKYAGMTGHEMIMSNVEMDPAKQKDSWISKLNPFNSKDGKFGLTWLDRVGKNFTNSMIPYEKATKFLMDQAGIKELEPSKDPIILARLLNGVNSKIDQIFEQGLVNAKEPIKDGKPNYMLDPVTQQPMNFNWLVEPLDNTDEGSIKKEQGEVSSLMIADRTLELEKKLDRKSLLTGIGAGIFLDVDVAKKRIEEFNSESPEKQARLKEAARRYRQYADHVLQYAADSGRLNEEQLKSIRENNLQYVALQRNKELIDEEIASPSTGKGGSLASTKELIYKIKGGADTIKNPYQNLIENTVKTIREADRNNVLSAFKDLFTQDRSMYEGEPLDLGQIARPGKAGDENTISIYENGEKNTYQLQPDVYKSVKGILDVSGKIPGFISALPRLLRWTVVHSPVFAVRNRIRDIGNRAVITDTKFYDGFDVYKSKSLKKLTDEVFNLSGAGQAGFYLLRDDFYHKKMDEALSELSLDKKSFLSTPGRFASKAWDSYNNLISSGEIGTRREEYRSAFKKAKEKGLDDYNASLYAAYNARDLLDFAVAGDAMKLVNQVVPFSNAAVQGLRKTFKAAKTNPAGFASKMLLYSVLPTLLTRLISHSMGRDEDYKNLPDYRRDLFYNIPVGHDMWLTIPKPFEIGVLSSGVERFVSKMFFNDDKAMDGYAGSVARNLVPVDDAALAGGYRPVLESIANYDFFRNKHIIPTDEEKKEIGLRHTERASRLGLAFQKVFGVDARKSDYLVKAQTGYFGDLAIRLSDLGRDKTKYPFDWTSTGLIKHDPVYDSKVVQSTMDLVDKYNISSHDPLLRMFNLMISDYYNQTDPNLKMKAETNLRNYAKTLNEFWGSEMYRHIVYIKNKKDYESNK